MAGDTGAPGFIPLYDDDTEFTPIQDPFNGISQALNAALKKSGFATYDTYATLNLPANAGTVVGQHATVNADSTPALNTDYVWSGTAWIFARPIFAAGTAGIQLSNQNVISVAITFPSGRFSVAPVVTTSLQAANNGAQKLVARASAVTASGFNLVLYSADLSLTTISAATNPVGWQAIQMTPTAAVG